MLTHSSQLELSNVLQQEIEEAHKFWETLQQEHESSSLKYRLGIDDRLDALRDKIARQKTVEKKMRELIEPHAQKSCRVLCAAMYNELPREIRDIIYTYVHVQNTIYVGPEYLHANKRPATADPDAHYWNADYLGSEIQREIVENWYRTTLFYFYDKSHNAEVIQQFLVTDQWGLGIRPHDFICRVKFELGPSTYSCHSKINCRGPQQGCQVFDLAGPLVKPLENLYKLPNHVHFLIRIHTYGALEYGCLREEELRDVITALVGHLKDFDAAGHRFLVQWAEAPAAELSCSMEILDVDKHFEKLKEVTPSLWKTKRYR